MAQPFNLFNFSNLGGVSSIVSNPQVKETPTYTEKGVTKKKPQWQIDMENKNKAPTTPDRSNTILWKTAQATNEFFKANPSFMSQWPKEIFGGISQWLQNTATSIKNAGYGDAEWMAEQQKSFISDMLAKGYDKETIFKAMDQLKSQGKFQGSISENPITGTLASIASAPLQALGTIAKGGESAARAWELAQEGNTSGAAATFGRGLTEGALWGLGFATWFTPGGAAVNTAFSSETVGQPLEKYVSAPIRKGVAKWQEALGYNPQSEGSQALQETAGMVWPLAVLWAGQKYVAPRITNVLTKKPSLPSVKWVWTSIGKSLENIADISATNINRMNAGQIRKFNTEIWVSPWKFLLDRGITDTGDNLVTKLADNLKESRKSADTGLANIEGKFKAPTQEIATTKLDKSGKYITEKVDPVETMLKDNLSNASSKGMSKESLRAKELLERYQQEWLTMSEINEAKRFLNANNKFSYFSDDVTPRKGFITNLDNEVRKWQFKTAEEQGFTNLKDINMDTKAYYKLLEGIGWWQDKIAWNNPMGLTDWLAFNADPSLFLAKQVAQSNIVKRGYLKWINALSGRKTQEPVKLPSNSKKNGILNSSNSTPVASATRKDVKKPLINLAEEKAKAKPISSIPEAKSNPIKNEQIKSQSPIGTIQQNGSKFNPLDLSKNKKGSLNIGQIGKDLGLVKKVHDELKGLAEEAKKYKDARDMYNNLPTKQREIFDEKWIYSLKHFEDFYKKNILDKKWTVIYRWQTKEWKDISYNDTKFMGNTDGWVFFSNTKDSASKYWKNIIEKISNKSNTVSISESKKLQKMAEDQVKKDIKNWIKSRNIIEQMALWRPRAFSEYTKKPFLETWDMFGEPWEMIYYKEFDK